MRVRARAVVFAGVSDVDDRRPACVVAPDRVALVAPASSAEPVLDADVDVR